MELIYFFIFWGVVAIGVGIWDHFDHRRIMKSKKEAARKQAGEETD